VLLVLRDGAVVGSAPVADFAEPGDGGLREEAVTRWLTKSGALEVPASGPGRPGQDVQGGASDSVRSGILRALIPLLLVPWPVLMHWSASSFMIAHCSNALCRRRKRQTMTTGESRVKSVVDGTFISTFDPRTPVTKPSMTMTQTVT